MIHRIQLNGVEMMTRGDAMDEMVAHSAYEAATKSLSEINVEVCLCY